MAASVASAMRCGQGIYAKGSDRLCILKYRYGAYHGYGGGVV